MKTALKLTLASLLLAAPAAQAQIEINENLSIGGFIDSSIGFGGGDTSIGVDQVEINFDLSFDGISANIDLDDENGSFGVEQANITLDLGEGSSLTAGKFLSYMGWETYDPTGLFQFSGAYAAGGMNRTLYPAHSEGIKFDIDGFGIALLDRVYGSDNGLNSEDYTEYGIEVKYSFSPAEGWNVFIGYALDVAGDRGNDDTSLINLWASYETGIHTFAAEYSMAEVNNSDVDQLLVMWNAAITDEGSVTARISQSASPYYMTDFTKYTVAYLHAVNENLTMVFELSEVDWDDSSNSTEAAIEALFTF
tara:strand:- start:534 stop:1454 length:921 start_codon:yes stop_codon:yes gene_type:complete